MRMAADRGKLHDRDVFHFAAPPAADAYRSPALAVRPGIGVVLFRQPIVWPDGRRCPAVFGRRRQRRWDRQPDANDFTISDAEWRRPDFVAAAIECPGPESSTPEWRLRHPAAQCVAG